MINGAALAGHDQVAINGQLLSPAQVSALGRQLGTRIAPGNYLLDYRSGCWANLTTGQQGCRAGGGGEYTSRHGSGGWNDDGDWHHYSGAAGGAVGGTGEGC